jgi:radical SAM superfamily enzyme YgiQ (UPF0313 family)
VNDTMQTATRKEIARIVRSENTRLPAKAYGDIRLALVYPNSYRLAMSNLGFQTVYALMNRNPLSRCERSVVLESGEAVTLESGSTLSSFDVVAFSVSFELDYPNIVEILRRAKIPVRSEERQRHHPLILVGGAAAMLNPEPMADFVDVFVVGEAETVLDDLLCVLAENKGKDKAAVKESAAQLPGVYVPSLYRVELDETGALRADTPRVGVWGQGSGVRQARGEKPLSSCPGSASRPRISTFPHPGRRPSPPDITRFSTMSQVLTPDTVFGERVLIEVSRGCPRGCKFCAARSIYFPTRWRSAESVLGALRQGGFGNRESGIRNRIGLLGAAVGDHPEIEEMCLALAEEGADLSISSVRPDRLSPAVARALARGNLQTLTIAPEAGCESMRKEIGKPLSDTQLLECTRLVKDSGIPSLKTYFIVGLPGEKGEDVEGIVARVLELSSLIRVKVSISAFVPKPRTPYERLPMQSREYLKRTFAYLQRELRRIKGVTFAAASPRQSHLQAALSRGGRDMSRWLEEGFPSPRVVEEVACREIPDEELLPWDVVQEER